MSILKELNVDFIDIKKELNEKNVNFKTIFPFGLSGHYNKTGYDIISKIIFKKIRQN